MPLKKYLDEAQIAPEVARAMVEAFAAVTTRAAELGHEMSPSYIVQKLAALAAEDVTDAQKLTEALLEPLISKKN